MKMCRNCKNRWYTDSWGMTEGCLGYELTEERDDPEQAEIEEATNCSRYEEGDPEKEEDCCPSATAGDYSPSSPWCAPGMSIRDFI